MRLNHHLFPSRGRLPLRDPTRSRCETSEKSPTQLASNDSSVQCSWGTLVEKVEVTGQRMLDVFLPAHFEQESRKIQGKRSLGTTRPIENHRLSIFLE